MLNPPQCSFPTGCTNLVELQYGRDGRFRKYKKYCSSHARPVGRHPAVRYCKFCGEKDPTAFLSGRATLCKNCDGHKDGVRNPYYDRRRHLSKYKITPEQYDVLFKEQNGLCAVCHKPPLGIGKQGLVIDHDHVTGRVRALIHTTCNCLLGHAQEDIETLEGAIRYLTLQKGITTTSIEDRL